jgi:hypothetical protein
MRPHMHAEALFSSFSRLAVFHVFEYFQFYLVGQRNIQDQSVSADDFLQITRYGLCD